MERRTVAAGVLLVLAVVVFVDPFPPEVAPHESSVSNVDDEFVSARALERGTDGDWWVLESSLDSSNAAVYRYDADMTPTDDRYALSAGAGERSTPVDIHQRPDGTWYVLTGNNTIRVYTDSWTNTNRTIRLQSPAGVTSAGRPSAFERTADGWWVDANGRLTLYDHAFENVLASYDPGDDLALGTAYYNSHYGRMRVDDVTVIHASDSDSLWLRASLGDDTYRFRTAGQRGLASGKPDETLAIEANPPYVTDIEAGAHGRRYVLRRNGNVYAYTTDWIFTGQVWTVGSGEAVDKYPGHFPTFEFIGAIIDGSGRLVPLAGLLGVAALHRRFADGDGTVLPTAAVAGVAAYAVYYDPAPLRPLVTWHPVGFVLTLACTAVAIGYHVLEDDRPLALLALYSPILYGGASLLWAAWG